MEIRLIERQCGGWLALSPVGDPIQIGVTRPTKPAALAGFKESYLRWQQLLGLRPEPTGIIGYEWPAVEPS